MAKTRARQAAARKSGKPAARARTRERAPAQSTGLIVGNKGGVGSLSQAQRDTLKERFSDDDFMYERIQNLLALQNHTGAVSLAARYEMGRVLREIKGKRREDGVKQAAEALGCQVQAVYDVITLHERIPEKTMQDLMKLPVNFTVLNNIAHCEDAKTRNALLRQLLNGDRLTSRDVRGLIQHSAPKRGNGGRRVKIPSTVSACSIKLTSGLSVLASTVPVLVQAFREKLSEMAADSLDDKTLQAINQTRESLATTANLLRDQLQEVELALTSYRGATPDEDEDVDDEDTEDDDDPVQVTEDEDPDDEDIEDDDEDDVEDALHDAMTLDDDDTDDEEEEDDEHIRRRTSVAARVGQLRRPGG